MCRSLLARLCGLRSDEIVETSCDIANAIRFVFAGFWLALGHAISGALCCVTVIGIPFGVQHFKLAGLAIAPIGKSIVSIEVAKAASEANAKTTLVDLRTGS